MRGVSEVIAIILILMITISLAGLAYMFMSTTMSDVTSAAGSTTDTTTSSMLTSFTIENMDAAKIYLRNTGQTELSNLSVYVNSEPPAYNIKPLSLSPGQLGTITIYSFIPDGAMVKVTSPNGFTTSKVATPCSKAVGCWKFDEGSGTVAYDSSPYGNGGTIGNGTAWTGGLYGSALFFDGVNDYVGASIDNFNSQLTMELMFKSPAEQRFKFLVEKENSTNAYLWGLYLTGNSTVLSTYVRLSNDSVISTSIYGGPWNESAWHHLVGTFDGRYVNVYVDGLKNSTDIGSTNTLAGGTGSLYIGAWNGNNQWFNGTIDEVRIYNRAIY